MCTAGGDRAGACIKPARRRTEATEAIGVGVVLLCFYGRGAISDWFAYHLSEKCRNDVRSALRLKTKKFEN